MKTIFIIILCFIPWIYTWGQQDAAVVKADSLTYAIYLKGNWDALVKTGNQLIDDGIDFFYLRMRIAYAYFMKQNYRQAIPHYKKALLFKPNDAIANTYLCYAYEYGGRKTDAVAHSAKIDSVTYEKLYQRYKNPILAAGLFYTYNKGDAGETQRKIQNGKIPSTDGLQKTTNYYHIANAFLAHRIGRNITVSHNLSYLTKDEHNFAIYDSDFYNYPHIQLNQFNYDLKVNFNIKERFLISPFVDYTQFTIPLGDYDLNDYHDSYSNYGLMVHTHLPLWYFGASFSMGEVNLIKQQQAGLHVTFYPKGNLNLYYSLNTYLQYQNDTEEKPSTLIHKHLIGFKTTKNWWIELAAMPCEFMNFYDVVSGTLWNGLDTSQNLFSISHIFLLYKYRLSFIVNTSIYNTISKFVPSDNSKRINTFHYQNLNITGGVIWKL